MPMKIPTVIAWLLALAIGLRADPLPPPAASQAEVNAGTVKNKFVSPATLASWTGTGGGAFSKQITLDGQGSVLGAGTNFLVRFNSSMTVRGWALLSEQSGSVQLDIRKCTYAQYDAGATHPVSGDSIVASAPPQITSAVKNQDTTLTGWTTGVVSNDLWQITITSATSIKKAYLTVDFSSP